MSMMGPMWGGGGFMNPGTRAVKRGHDQNSKPLPKGLIKRVWRTFARPYRGRLILLVILISLTAALSVLPARLVGFIVDTITDPPPNAMQIVTGLALAMIALSLGTAGLSVAQRYVSSWIGEELIYDLRARLYDHVQRMPLAFFTRTQTGALISRLNNDVIGAQRALDRHVRHARGERRAGRRGGRAHARASSWRLTLLTLSVLPALRARWPRAWAASSRR